MADYNVLKAAIADYVKDRTGLSTIDGDGLQETLMAMVNSLGAGYQFIGVATPSTNPGTPDQNVFYIAAEPGTYTNFPISGGYLQVAENEVAIFKYNGQWSKETTGAATAAQVNQLGQEVTTQEEYIEVTVDDQNKIIEGITVGGDKKINVPVELSDRLSMQGGDIDAIDNTEWAEVKIDNNQKVIEGVRKDGTHVFNSIETKDAVIYGDLGLNKVPDIIQKVFDEMDDEVNKVIPTHLDKECELYAMSYAYPFYYYPGNERGGIGAGYNKKLVFAWMSDIHGKDIEYGRFVKYANHYRDVIDFMLVTGDLSTLAPRDGGWANTQGVYGKKALVPLLIGLGNHDITDNPGTGVIFDSLEEMDNELIMPWATQINWTNKGAGSYYYKDFLGNRYAYRVIMLNDYERPGLVADGSWKTISYDDSLSDYSSSAEYVAGDKVNLNEHSYEAVKSVSGIAPTRTYYDYQDGRYISQEQAEWLCQALSSMPQYYKAIICSHQMLGPTTRVSGNFTYDGGNTNGFQMCQNGHVIVDIINAFVNRTAIDKTYQLTKRHSAGGTDGEVIEGFDYTLEYDFSEVSNDVDIKCCLTGHTHVDMVTKLNGIENNDVYDIMITTGADNFQCNDLGCFGERARDAFNVVSVDSASELKMIRVGSDVTQGFTKRDNIIINI